MQHTANSGHKKSSNMILNVWIVCLMPNLSPWTPQSRFHLHRSCTADGTLHCIFHPTSKTCRGQNDLTDIQPNVSARTCSSQLVLLNTLTSVVQCVDNEEGRLQDTWESQHTYEKLYQQLHQAPCCCPLCPCQRVLGSSSAGSFHSFSAKNTSVAHAYGGFELSYVHQHEVHGCASKTKVHPLGAQSPVLRFHTFHAASKAKCSTQNPFFQPQANRPHEWELHMSHQGSWEGRDTLDAPPCSTVISNRTWCPDTKAMTHLVVLAKLCLRKSSEDFLQRQLYVPEWALADLQLRRHLSHPDLQELLNIGSSFPGK